MSVNPCPHPAILRHEGYCPICHRDAQIAELQAENRRLREAVRVRAEWERLLREALQPIAAWAETHLPAIAELADDRKFMATNDRVVTIGDLRRVYALSVVEAPEWTAEDEAWVAKLAAEGR